MAILAESVPRFQYGGAAGGMMKLFEADDSWVIPVQLYGSNYPRELTIADIVRLYIWKARCITKNSL